ncbi:M20/M25/M40 family metallo-hydrolase [bacterium]|nr:M20/M25/M40 family metallo-hydrolase [bacterium]
MTITETLQALVRIPSVSRAEQELAQWIARRIRELGVEATEHEDFVSAHILGEDGSRAVLFNGHTDTVEAGDRSLWKFPPDGPEAGVIEDGLLYGLGASDMKASLASFLHLIEFYGAHKPPVDLHFSFVVQEEITGKGSQSYVSYFREHFLSQYEDLVCIVGEPTDFAFVETGNRGVHFFELIVEGVACHASQAAGKSTNAPEIAEEALATVRELKQRWREQYTHPSLGEPAMTLTGIHSSPSSANSVPSTVKMRWDIRTTPGLHPVVEDELHAALDRFGEVIGMRDPCPCAFCPEDSTLLKTFRKALPDIEHRVARGGNDTGYFIEAGIPAVTFGPGKKGIIHQVNEHAPVDALQRSPEVYRSLVETYANG